MLNIKKCWIITLMISIIALTLLVAGCGSGVKSTKFTKDNIQQVLDDVKKSKDLTGEEHGLLAAAVLRNSFQKGGVLEGKTVGEVIEEQRRLKAEAEAREAEQKRLAEEARKKEEALAAEMNKYLVVTPVNKEFRSKDIYSGEFNDYILITFAFQNKGAKDIKAFRGLTQFNDLFGEKIYSTNLSFDEGVKAGEKKTWIGSIKFNQFIDEHVHFKNAELGNIKFQWKAKAIIFDDGTTLGNVK